VSVKALQVVDVNQVELTEFPFPVLEEEAILLKMRYCGICGTDMHGIEGKRSLQFPVIPGHELVAQVAKIGPKALERTFVFGRGPLQEGDWVTLNPRIICGRCYYCQNLPQKPEMCMEARTYNSSIGSHEPPHLFGGWSEYMYILPGSEIIKLPEEIDLKVASLIEPLACSVGMLDRYRRNHHWVDGDGFTLNKHVVVFGAGAIGLLAAACFTLAEPRTLICIDTVPEKLDLAKKLGADVVLDGSNTCAAERIAAVKETCEGLGADIVVEACGVPETIDEGSRMLRRGGTLFEMGHLMNTRPAQIDAHLICRNELEIIGNYAYPSGNCLLVAAQILLENKLPFNDLITLFKMDDFQNALFGKHGNIVKSVFDIS